MEVDYILNGDCLKALKTFNDKSLDCAFTSPPYNRVRNDTYEFYNDNNSNYFDLLVTSTDELLRICKKYVIVNIQMNHFNKKEFCDFVGRFSSNICGNIVWEKTNPQPNLNYREDEKTYSVTNAYENFFVLSDNQCDFRANEKITNVIRTSVNSEHIQGHGAIMKREVAEFFIRNFTKENDVVIDPFMGTGTTALACIKQKRHYIGIEMSKEYCKIANNRIDDFTSQLSFFY